MRHLPLILLIVSTLAFGADKKAAKQKAEKQAAPAQENPAIQADELGEDTYLDSEEALRSRKYVRRAVLSEMVKTNATLNVNSLYVNHLMGFSNVWQRGDQYAKYMSGMQGLAAGYVSKSGHAVELGAEFSSVGNLYGGYKYYMRPGISIWPFLSAGLGMEMKTLSLGDGPREARLYHGSKLMYFFGGGLLIPLVDVGLRAELRLGMYGKDRWVLTQGIGAVLFL